MKTKLIKLNDSHYIIVDDSEIKEGDYHLTDKKEIVKTVKSETGFANWLFPKITHSTQPLEYTNEDHLHWDKIKKLSLSEIEETVYGYSVEKMAKHCKHSYSWLCKVGYVEGFKAHQELTKDKLFTVDDMKKAIKLAREQEHDCGGVYFIEGTSEDIIQSLLPKTEWNIDFDEQGKIKLL